MSFPQTLPDFLVIGAMKAGTTTLYHDLSLNPEVFLADKEASGLITARTRSDYTTHFQGAGRGKLVGDVSTRYAMLPCEPDVVARARRILSRGTRIVYLVREPVARTLSHHNHMRTVIGPERMGPDINLEIQRRPELIAWSRYAMQLRPWIDAFGTEAVRVIVLEDYACRRREVVEDLCEWLGVRPHTKNLEHSRIHNDGTDRSVVRGPWEGLRQSLVYRRLVRPLTSLRFRDRVRELVLPRISRADAVPPTAATISRITDGVQEDVRSLVDWLGTGTSTCPGWIHAMVRGAAEDAAAVDHVVTSGT
jgi:hypothetical protein